MNIKKQKSKFTFLLIFAFSLSGCVSDVEFNQAQKAIIILIDKVDKLESFHVKSSQSSIPVYKKKSTNSRVVAYIPMGNIFISHCDKYGWCSLGTRSGYVQKWRIGEGGG